MGVKILKKKEKRDQSKFVPHRRSLPVDRYYSSRSFDRSTKNDLLLARARGVKKGNVSPLSLKQTLLLFARRLLQWGGFVGAIAVIFLNLSLSGSGVKITASLEDDQAVQRYEYRDQKDYAVIVSEVFESSFMNRSKLTLNSHLYEQELQRRLPEVEDALAIVPLVGTRLQVGIQITHPLARIQLGGDRQGVVGRNGVLIYESSTNTVLEKFVSLPLLTTVPLLQVEAGERVLTSKEVSLLTLLMAEFDGSTQTRPDVTSITHDIEGREFQVHFKSMPFFAKLSSESDVRLQVGSLVAASEDFSRTGDRPNQYVDVRAPGRIFAQ